MIHLKYRFKKINIYNKYIAHLELKVTSGHHSFLFNNRRYLRQERGDAYGNIQSASRHIFYDSAFL